MTEKINLREQADSVKTKGLAKCLLMEIEGTLNRENTGGTYGE